MSQEKIKLYLKYILLRIVPREGLEPPRPKALVPKTSVYTNFTTPATYLQNIALYKVIGRRKSS